MTYKVIAVDLQNDFATVWGNCYKLRPSVEFVLKRLVPFFRANKIKLYEIISDYRQPKPRSTRNNCVPWTRWFESVIPKDIKFAKPWVKAMNSPIRVRENIFDWSKETSMPYQDSHLFDERLLNNIWPRDLRSEIILIGLTLDCCVLCLAQELSRRWYKVTTIIETVDTYSWDQDEKNMILSNYPLKKWLSSITWNQFIERYH